MEEQPARRASGWVPGIVAVVWAAACCAVVNLPVAVTGASSVSSAGWPGTEYILTVGGPHGWNPHPESTHFAAWAEQRMYNAAVGNVLVFRSDPGSNSTVVVFTTGDTSLTPATVCREQASSGSSSYGTNRFGTGVSLVLLKPSTTYWFLSGWLGECEAGMVFGVTVKRKSGAGGAYDYYGGLGRDVGVAYTVAYTDPSGARFTSLGSAIPAQPVAFDNSSATAGRYFTGDALNVAFHGFSTLFVNSNSGGSKASCSSNREQLVFGPAPAGAGAGTDVQLVSVFLGGNQSDQFRDSYLLTLSASGICEQGITLADISIRNATAAEICERKPGPPYLCSNALKLAASWSGGTVVLLASMALLLLRTVG